MLISLKAHSNDYIQLKFWVFNLIIFSYFHTFGRYTIYLIKDDFNGHNTLFGNINNDLRGGIIEQFLAKNDKYVLWMICLTPTFIQERRHYFYLSILLLAITVSWSCLACLWRLIGHFSIVIEQKNVSTEDHNPKWKPNIINWDAGLLSVRRKLFRCFY